MRYRLHLDGRACISSLSAAPVSRQCVEGASRIEDERAVRLIDVIKRFQRQNGSNYPPEPSGSGWALREAFLARESENPEKDPPTIRNDGPKGPHLAG